MSSQIPYEETSIPGTQHPRFQRPYKFSRASKERPSVRHSSHEQQNDLRRPFLPTETRLLYVSSITSRYRVFCGGFKYCHSSGVKSTATSSNVTRPCNCTFLVLQNTDHWVRRMKCRQLLTGFPVRDDDLIPDTGFVGKTQALAERLIHRVYGLFREYTDCFVSIQNVC